MISICLSCLAETVEFRPVADTTLHEITPNNNMGGHTHVAIGSTAKDTSARGLFRFDLATIPTNAAISLVSLTFTLPALNRPDAGSTPYAVHRVLTAWSEGTRTGNLGAAATAGESSWNHSALPALWSAAGGDFVARASVTQAMGPAPGVFTVVSSTGLIADVQHWILHPDQNFGWLLKAEDESIAQTARQIASRETTNAPILRVEYSVRTAEKLRITTIERINTNVVIRWTGGSGNVVVETVRVLGAAWEQLGVGAEGIFTHALRNEHAFVRLREE